MRYGPQYGGTGRLEEETTHDQLSPSMWGTLDEAQQGAGVSSWSPSQSCCASCSISRFLLNKCVCGGGHTE